MGRIPGGVGCGGVHGWVGGTGGAWACGGGGEQQANCEPACVLLRVCNCCAAVAGLRVLFMRFQSIIKFAEEKALPSLPVLNAWSY